MSCCHNQAPVATIEGAVRIGLIGNPNAGKSTLFNALTGLNAKVGNYPGVTVARYVGTAKVDGREVVIEDLPGTYSLDPISPDEQVVAETLDLDSGERADGVVVVLDATSLQRSLGLLSHALQLGLPTYAVLTFADELARRQGSIDPAALSEALGIPVLMVTAGHGAQVMDLKRELLDPASWSRPVVTPPITPSAINGWIASVLEAAKHKPAVVDDRTRRIDAVLLHPVLGFIIFLVAMFLFFQTIFTVAAPIQDLIGDGFGALGELVSEHVGIDWLAGLLAGGIIGGVGGVLEFIPQIALLFLLLGLFESTGYMARVAYLMDRLMGKAGLEGRAFIAMLSSLACAVPGIMATRTLPSARDRLATMMTAPLMTCSARLPVYTLLVAMLIPSESRIWIFGTQGVVMFAMYLLGAVGAMAAAWVFKFLLRGKGPALPFYMEMPSYRLPSWREVGRSVWDACWIFLRRVGGIILALSIALWILLSLPVASEDRMTAAGVDIDDEVAVAQYQLDNSIAAGVGKAIQPVFEPLGFDWRITVGLVAAMGAREVFVATMAQVTAAEDEEDPQAELTEMTWLSGPHEGELLFTPGVIAGLLLYFAFALQCTSTVAALKRESGSWKWPAIAFVYMTAMAWIAAFIGKLIVGALVG